MTQNAIPGLHMRGPGTVSLMAATALAGCRRYMVMIHLQWIHQPRTCVVAGVTFIGGWSMVCGLALCGVIVVTAYAGSQCLIVIHTQQGYPGYRPVAGLTSIGSRYMVYWFAGRQ